LGVVERGNARCGQELRLDHLDAEADVAT